jgi:large repetitive protein
MNRFLYLGTALFLFGCEDAVKVETEPLTSEGEMLSDSDGDGYLSDEDCDDDDGNVNPGAEEICDGFDNDCDNQSDEGVTTEYFVDSDGDGFGNPDIATDACQPPEGFVVNGSDCDDTDGSSYPSAAESCDGLDNDCNGEVDDGLGEIYFLDEDSDGFGGVEEVEACDLRDGLSAIGGDCDDLDETVSPAASEVCDGLDNDCDLATDEGVTTTHYADSDGDGYGSDDQTQEACQAPVGYVLESGDCDDLEIQAHPGADEYCDGQDNDCDGDIDEADSLDASLWYGDFDGDGFGQEDNVQQSCDQPIAFSGNAEDCDDGDDDVYPGAEESCNGVDDDCDLDVDEDAVAGSSTWFEDSDGDGYGDPAASIEACSQPPGHVGDSTDCDDNDDDAYPGAQEYCNEVDDNCDGQADEEGSVFSLPWYLDADGDGHGDAEVSIESCEPVDGYVLDDGDCDDGAAEISPSAVELCNGGDDNCDGLADDADPLVDGGGIWHLDHDGDGYGDASYSAEACDQPAGFVVDGTDCDDLESAAHPGASEICDGLDNDCDGDSDDADTDLDPNSSMSWYLDADGDGHGDPGTSVQACEAPPSYVDTMDDCDDLEPSIHPAADEYCDGADNDCDGTVDESDAVDAVLWYADQDGDGHGAADSSQVACSAPEFHVSSGEDCDDSAFAISPDAEEVCNEIDDDCDLLIDDVDPSVSDLSSWFLDHDSDGYGDLGFPLESCSQPEGYVSDSTDCNDLSAQANPVASEYCDGMDNDCDGVSDESDALDATAWFLDSDGDGYGDPDSAQAACELPENHVANSGDCDDQNNLLSPDFLELCDGLDNDCDGNLDESDAEDASDWYLDGDEDGYGLTDSLVSACSQPPLHVAVDGDCDDSLSEVSPIAEEVCNDLDDDCDGDTDEGQTTDYFQDGDEDGFGAGDAIPLCGPSEGHVLDGTDCDDAAAAVFPGAEEVCNGLDDNCAGGIDEGVTIEFYLDFDGDGFGGAAFVEISCEAPEGYVADASDCDDALAEINPDAEEVCNELDDDCNDEIDETAIGTSASCAASSCEEILAEDPAAADGLYYLDPDGGGAIEAQCDMTTSGGGWTLVGKFTNQDARSWANSPSNWTSSDSFGTASDLEVGADAKSPLWHRLEGTDFMLTDDYNPGDYIHTNDGCIGGQTLSAYFTSALSSFPWGDYGYYDICTVDHTFVPNWATEPDWSSQTASSSQISLNASQSLVIAKTDSGGDTSGVISFYEGSDPFEADVGLGALEDGTTFTDTGNSQDIGGPTSCSYDDSECASEYPETVFFWVR